MTRRIAGISLSVCILLFLPAAPCPAQPSAQDSLAQAESLYMRSRFDQAVAVLNAAVEKDPHDAKAFFLRADAHYNKQDFGAALSDLDTGLSLMPGHAQGYYNRAVVHYVMLDYDRAWDDARRASALGYRLDPVFFEQLKEDSGRQQ
ncbi:MAG TPA: tetratricopeptide repeat protein [Candidatus Omnitrophota bacterium]|nr:tetratricopeptide repeat protein [Candidatus Omnitrophota bacterium]